MHALSSLFSCTAQPNSVRLGRYDNKEPSETEFGHPEIWSQGRFSFGYSGVLVHDEDAFVFAMMHFLLYQEKPCDLLFEVADSVRNGVNKDHFLRYNKKFRYITHNGKMSSLAGKVFGDGGVGV